MALTLNGGANTIGGLAVGGLPDGIVDIDMLATSVARGKILQVVQSVKTDVSSTTTKESWLDIAGTDQAGSGSVFCVKITPTAATSKILFSTTVHYHTTNNNIAAIGLYRDSTLITQGDAATSKMRASSMMYESDDINIQLKHLQYLDSPNSTSELTYKQQHYTYNEDAFYVNRCTRDYAGTHYDHRVSSILTVMEVAA